MFKNILKFLFEEDDEIIDEQPLEPIKFEEEVKLKAKEEENQPIRFVNLNEPKKETPVIKEKPIEVVKPKNRFIDLDEPEIVKPPVRIGKSESKKEYEFSPVISPIFGTKEDMQTRQKMDQEPTVSRLRKKNPLGTVISPMYGATELEAMEDEAQEKLAAQDESKQTNQEFPFPPEIEDSILNMPLEDLLAQEEEEEADRDDLIQFSLFGEEEVIKENKSPIFSLDEEA